MELDVRLVLDAMPMPAIILDMAWRINHSNPSALALLRGAGCSKPEPPFPPPVPLPVKNEAVALSYLGRSFSISLLRDESEQPVGYLCVLVAADALPKLLFSGKLWAAEFDLHSGLMLQNYYWQGGKQITAPGFTYDQLLNQLLDWVSPAQQAETRAALNKGALLSRLAQGEREVSCRFQCRKGAGDKPSRYIWAKATAHVMEESPACAPALLLVTDIDTQMRRQLALTRRANLDPLTGLYNRAVLQARIGASLQARPDVLSALIVLDVDDFKGINDTHGHIFGDAALCALGKKLLQGFPFHATVGRMGGDEFIVFLEDVHCPCFVIEQARRLCRALSRPFGFSGQFCQLSCSIGVAFTGPYARTFSALYHGADTALYKAKALGKKQVVVYSNEKP